MKHFILPLIFFLSTGLIVLDHLTDFEINHSGVYFIIQFIVLLSLLLSIRKFFIQIKNIYLLLLIVSIGVFCYTGYFFTWGGEWCTQTILYQNKKLKNRTIEYQMVDIGAFGYSRRTIDRIKILPFFDWTKEIQKHEMEASDWERVDIYVNDIELKEI
ncbi:MAG: hypothetical protein K0R51_338 [Cytophagaceae bacterium]|jgi:hypothetical protein|nr:hypothetical protein [Cytophagaceae bacterium]